MDVQRQQGVGRPLDLFEVTAPARPGASSEGGTRASACEERQASTATDRKRALTNDLMERVCSDENLNRAYGRVKSNKGSAGVDGMTIAALRPWLDEHREAFVASLLDGSYQPQPVLGVDIPKPGGGVRQLGIPTVVDRLVQQAILQVLDPLLDPTFSASSYGFRPGRSAHDALAAARQYVADGRVIVVDLDLKSYFDTIPHDRLMALLEERVADGRVLSLVRAFLTQGVMDGLDEWVPTAGSPHGAVFSPLLSNTYLDPLDHEMAKAGCDMVRYADDLVILCRSASEARQALERVEAWTANAELTLHPDKARVLDANQEGFDFLGYHFERGKRWPRDKSLQKFKDAIRAKTLRKHGHRLSVIIASVNQTTWGWFEYFKHTSYTSVFRCLDGLIRRRLRRILLKRHRHHDHNGRGLAHYQWPNAYFAEQGLFSMEAAHVRLRQSAARWTTNRRAGCGRTACPVRREEEPGIQPALPTPIRDAVHIQ